VLGIFTNLKAVIRRISSVLGGYNGVVMVTGLHVSIGSLY
jgi:hypothetical protein